VTAGNDASKRLLEKVGFVQEGELREASGWRVAGITTGCLVCCAMNTAKADNSPVIFLSLCQA
jgi:RimJ/RimL family protein N-acetyltransferase